MKKILAYTSALLVYMLGTLCYLYYFTSKEMGIITAAAMVGSMIIFFPAFSYWVKTFKDIFNIEE